MARRFGRWCRSRSRVFLFSSFINRPSPITCISRACGNGCGKATKQLGFWVCEIRKRCVSAFDSLPISKQGCIQNSEFHWPEGVVDINSFPDTVWISCCGVSLLKMHHMKRYAVSSMRGRWSGIMKSGDGVCSLVELRPSMSVSDAGLSGFSSLLSGRTASSPGTTDSVRNFLTSIQFSLF